MTKRHNSKDYQRYNYHVDGARSGGFVGHLQFHSPFESREAGYMTITITSFESKGIASGVEELMQKMVNDIKAREVIHEFG